VSNYKMKRSNLSNITDISYSVVGRFLSATTGKKFFRFHSKTAQKPGSGYY